MSRAITLRLVVPSACLAAAAVTSPTAAQTATQPSVPSLARHLVDAPGYHVAYADTTLENGLRVIVVDRPLSGLVAVDLLVRVGQRDDPPGRLGMAHFLEHVTYNEQLVGYVRRAGIQFPAYTDYEATAFTMNAPRSSLDAALYVLSDVLRRPPAGGDVAKPRQDVAREYASVPPQPHMLAARCAFQLYHLGRCLTTPDMLAELDATTSAELDAMWRTTYRPNNALVVVVGDVRASDVVWRVARSFEDLLAERIPQRQIAPPAMEAQPRRVVLQDSIAASARLTLTYRTAPIDATDLPALLVLREALGGGDDGLLNRRLTGDGRPATRVEISGAGLLGATSPAPLSITADLRPGMSVDSAKQVVVDELRRVAAGEIDGAALERAKARLVRRFVVDSRARGVRGLAYYVGSLAVAGRLDLINEWPSVVDAVSAGDVAAAAARYLLAEPRFTLVSAPPSARSDEPPRHTTRPRPR